VLGLVGVAFFWLTDPTLGVEPLRLSDGNPVDLAREATPGTVVGIAGSAVTLLLGLFLATRRPA
jgi:hypothetical protein